MQTVKRLVEQIRSDYIEVIAASRRFSEDFKRSAIQKIKSIKVVVGFPPHWPDYSQLQFDPLDMLSNHRKMRQFEVQRSLSRLGRVQNDSDYLFKPYIVNAYYTRANQIRLHAAFLNLPVFNRQWREEKLYASLGITIAHEFSHAFDRRSRYWGNGVVIKVLKSDKQQFALIRKMMARQAKAYVTQSGVSVQSNQIFRENFADLAGMQVLYYSYLKRVSSAKTPEGRRRLFSYIAAHFRSKLSDQRLKAEAKNGTRQVPEYRVNGTLRQVDDFYRVFDIPPGSKMYLKNSQRIRVW